MSTSAQALWRERNPEKVKANRLRYYNKNKERINAAAKIWRAANPEKHKQYKDVEKTRHFFYIHRYGISLETYNAFLKDQGGVCAICLQEETSCNSQGVVASLCVDHCHVSGRIRGLLCRNCNSGLGKLRDSKEVLQRAI